MQEQVLESIALICDEFLVAQGKDLANERPRFYR
jgi:hypothetical protein